MRLIEILLLVCMLSLCCIAAENTEEWRIPAHAVDEELVPAKEEPKAPAPAEQPKPNSTDAGKPLPTSTPLPGEHGGVTLLPTAWNNGGVSLVAGAWQKAGADVLNQSFPQIDPKGYNFTLDFVRWVSFTLKPEYLPQGLEYRVLPLAKGCITTIDHSDVKNIKGTKTDGFVVRYAIDNYQLQITDTLYDLQIVVRDMSKKEAATTTEAQQLAAEQVVRRLLNNHLVKYPDGSWRKQKIYPFPAFTLGLWNWIIEDKIADYSTGGESATTRPFECVALWYSDEITTVINFVKIYHMALPVNALSPEAQTRFSHTALFHDIVMDVGADNQ